MSKVCIGDIIQRIKIKVDKDETDLEYYVGGEHFDSGEVTVTRYGKIAGSTIGPAFNTRFTKGDVLLMSRNPHLRKAGMVDFDGICSDVSYICRTRDESILLQEFIPFIYQSDAFWGFAEANKRGSTNFFLNWSDFERYELELPSLAKQRELVEVLWAADRAKKSYQNLIKSTDELVKSQFIEMFGALLKDPNQCSVIEKICVLFSDGDWIESKDQSDSGIRLIQTGNVGNGVYIDKGERARYISQDTFEKLHCTEVKPRDILISRLPDPVGRACIVPEGLGKTITAVDCSIVRLCEKVLPEFFVAFTLTPLYAMQVVSRITGSTRQRISRKNLGNIMLPVPPIELQEEFAAFVRQSDKSKFALLSISNLNL